MGHKTYINGTGYDITGGRAKINGTSYDIVKGRTKINGTGYDISFVTQKSAGAYNVGDSVYISENGTFAEYIVVNQGLPSTAYDASCEGTWILRETLLDKMAWNETATEYVSYMECDLKIYLNSTFYNTLGTKEKVAIKTVTIPAYIYATTPGSSSGVYSLSDQKVFAPSYAEVGSNPDYARAVWEGDNLEYFANIGHNNASDVRQARKDDPIVTTWWLRTPSPYVTGYKYYAFSVGSNGHVSDGFQYSEAGVRPMMILDSDALFDPRTNKLL